MPCYTEKTGELLYTICQLKTCLGVADQQSKDRKSTKWNEGKTKKGWKPFSPPKINWYRNSSEGNEENGHPVPDSNKTKIDYPKESNKPYKNTLKEEILQEITENFMEMLLDKINQMYRRHSRNSKTTKIKNMRRHKNKLMNS
jgi:hypothetical protein